MTMRALLAAEELSAHNVDVAVVHTPTLKPFDADTVLAEIDSDRLAVTLENHTVVGGLFETVASEALRRGLRRQVTPIALPDEFLAAGALPTLHDRYGLSTRASSPRYSTGCSMTVDSQMLTVKERPMSMEASLLRLEKTSLREQALTALRRAITTGQLTPGTHLVETDLSEALQISRGTLREAMRQLQQEGLISAGARGRLSVRHLDAKEIKDIFDVRAALESLAASTLAARQDKRRR